MDNLSTDQLRSLLAHATLFTFGGMVISSPECGPGGWFITKDDGRYYLTLDGHWVPWSGVGHPDYVSERECMYLTLADAVRAVQAQGESV